LDIREAVSFECDLRHPLQKHRSHSCVEPDAVLDHRPGLERESQIPEWQEKARTKTVYKMVLRLTTWLLANNSMTQLETPAGVS
jgi:hypothetical protein